MAMELTGVQEVLNQLQLKASQIDGKVKKEATKAGAEIFRKEMSSNAPRSSIGKEHLADNIVAVETKNGYEIGPAAKFYYAYFLEYGTSKMKSQPFVAPTFENNRVVVEKTMSAVLKARLGL